MMTDEEYDAIMEIINREQQRHEFNPNIMTKEELERAIEVNRADLHYPSSKFAKIRHIKIGNYRIDGYIGSITKEYIVSVTKR